MKKTKRFIFTIDDNVRFFRDLTEKSFDSLFSHPYLALLKKLHIQFGVKVQLNCFFKDENGFDLSIMTEKYKQEWEENSQWLKLSFHSKKEFPIEPYKQTGYAEVYEDCLAVHREIKRFAGAKSLAKTTTIHYCLATKEGVKALKKCGIKGLLGLYGTDEEPRNSYSCTLKESDSIRKGNIVKKDGLFLYGIDLILNMYEPVDILGILGDLNDRKLFAVMIHEQFFYKDYAYYQSNFQKKLETAFQCLMDSGFESVFYENLPCFID